MKLFSRDQKVFGLDIGTSSIKLAEVDVRSGKNRLLNAARFELEENYFSNYSIANTDELAEHIVTILEANSILDRDAVVGVPGPSVFVKKIKMPLLEEDELRDNIQLEAASFIPHNIEQVHLDFHVIGPSGKNNLDVLLIAVKNEVIDSFVDTVATAGFDTAIVDVDYFALQNAFEMSSPELVEETNAIVSIGSRQSVVNICQGGESHFAGYITVGGAQFTEAIQNVSDCTFKEAERLKREFVAGTGVLPEEAKSALLSEVETAAGELAKQLNFFWDAASNGSPVRRVVLTGGGSLTPRLDEELSERLGIECMRLDPLASFEIESSLDQQYVEEMKPFLAVAIGLAQRSPGDREAHEYA